MAEKNIKILLAEDDVFLLNMYAEKFRTESFDVIIADNGIKALKTAKDEIPDIMILDIMLPKMNGFEVLEDIRKDEEIKDTPVIILTNLESAGDVQKAIELGAKDYLVKANYKMKEVLEKIKLAIK